MKPAVKFPRGNFLERRTRSTSQRTSQERIGGTNPLWLRHNGEMAKRRVTVALDEETLRVLDRERSRSGQSRSSLIDQALAREIAGSALERVWASARSLPDEEAMELAISELRASRLERRKRAAS